MLHCSPYTDITKMSHKTLCCINIIIMSCKEYKANLLPKLASKEFSDFLINFLHNTSCILNNIHKLNAMHLNLLISTRAALSTVAYCRFARTASDNDNCFMTQTFPRLPIWCLLRVRLLSVHHRILNFCTFLSACIPLNVHTLHALM